MKNLNAKDGQRRKPVLRAKPIPLHTEHDKAVAFLAKVATKVTTVFSLQGLLAYVIRALREDAGFESCSVALLDDDGAFVIKAASGLRASWQGMVIPRGLGLHGATAASRRPLLIPDIAADSRVYRGDSEVGSGIYVPLITRGRVTGILSTVRHTPAFDETDMGVLIAVAGYLATAIEAARLHERLREQATTDPLTGLANQRSLRRALELELARARRSGQALSVVFVEIDRFKEINDQFGHLKGDETLCAVATELRRSCRETDLVARFGGDEFVLVLPGADSRNAFRVAERARRSVTRLRHLATRRVTVTLGIATCEDRRMSSDALLDAADRAMYRAKRAGGDRVVTQETRVPLATPKTRSGARSSLKSRRPQNLDGDSGAPSEGS